jgi:hypothetical protein
MFGVIELMFLPVLLLFAVPLSLAALAFWIWMLVHAIQNKGLSDSEKIVWVLVIALVHFIGAVIYFFVGRPKRTLGASTN